MSEPRTHKWLILIGVGIALLMCTVDGSIVNVALPSLTTDLHTQFHVVQWAVMSMLLGQAILMLTMGRLGDLVGKKWVFTTGLVVFVVFSALSGLAPGIYWLIVFRFIEAFGAAMILALGVAIVTETFPESERGRAIGISAGMISLGGTAGPALGGFILHSFTWRWLFFVNVPIGLLALALVAIFLPAAPPKNKEMKFDILGALFIGLTMLAFVLAMTFANRQGLFAMPVLSLLALFVIFLFIFARIEKRASHPIVDLSLFRNSAFSINLLNGFMSFVCLGGTLLIFPFYLQLVKQLDQREIGLIMAVAPVAIIIFGPISGMLSDKFGTRRVSLVGLVIILISYAILTPITAATATFIFVLLSIPNAVGMAIFQSPNNTGIMNSTPRSAAGVASGMLSLSRQLGRLTGTAILGAFFSRRLSAYAGKAVDLKEASSDNIVRAMHDQFILASLLIAAGLVAVIWQIKTARKQAKAEAVLEKAN